MSPQLGVGCHRTTTVGGYLKRVGPTSELIVSALSLIEQTLCVMSYTPGGA